MRRKPPVDYEAYRCEVDALHGKLKRNNEVIAEQARQIAELQKDKARLLQIALLLEPISMTGYTEEQWREIEEDHVSMSQTAKEQGK